MMRNKRLQIDEQKMRALHSASSLIDVDFREAPNRYRIHYKCKGLLWLPGAAGPSVTTKHTLDIIVHLSYPRVRPQLLWLTDIFHPNILPPAQNGGVCIGQWAPSETLDLLTLRVGEMVQMKSYNANDVLNHKAADWVRGNSRLFPLDHRPLIDPEPDIEF